MGVGRGAVAPGLVPLLICGRLAMEHPGGPVMRCRPETVCRWIYVFLFNRKLRF